MRRDLPSQHEETRPWTQQPGDLASAGREERFSVMLSKNFNTPSELGYLFYAMEIKTAGSHKLYGFSQKSSIEFKACGWYESIL